MTFNYRKNFFYFYTNVVKEYKKYSTKIFKDYNLTPAEIDVLTFLINNMPEYNTATEISTYIGISKGLVSRSVNSLVDKKIIKIDINPEDRRSQLLSFTDESKEFLEDLNRKNKFFRHMLIKNIDEGDMEKFFEVHEKIMYNLENMSLL